MSKVISIFQNIEKSGSHYRDPDFLEYELKADFLVFDSFEFDIHIM